MPIRFIDEESEVKKTTSIRFLDDEEPETVTPTEPTPEQKGYFPRLGEYYTKDIPEVVSGAVQRTGQRYKNIFKPTVLGSMATEKLGVTGTPAKIVESIAGTPERIGRTAGLLTGTVGEGAGVVQELGTRSLRNITGGKVDIEKAVTPVVEKVAQSKPVQKAIQWFDNLSEAEKANFQSALDMSEALGWQAGKGSGKAVSSVGKKTTTTGKQLLGGDLKIKQSLAKRGYGKNLIDKKMTILSNIDKYDLHKPTGNFQQMATDASTMASQKVKQADDILRSIASATDAPKGQFVDDIIQDAMLKIDDIAAVGKEGQADAIMARILEGATSRGVAGTGEKGIDAIIEFKRKLDPDGNLFKMGPAATDEDNLERAIRKELYKSSVKKIREFSPEAANLNVQAKELFDIAAVTDDAASRTANRNTFLSLPNMITGTAAGYATYSQTSDPIKTAAATLIPAATIKALGQGRGASGIMKTGSGLRRLGESNVLPYTGYKAVSDISRVNLKKEKRK